MVDHEVKKIADKLQKPTALRHAQECVRQLERELNRDRQNLRTPRFYLNSSSSTVRPASQWRGCSPDRRAP
jgi:hypothetical protein